MANNSGLTLKIIGGVAGAILTISGWIFGTLQIAQVQRIDKIGNKVEQNTVDIYRLDRNQYVMVEQLKQINEKIDILLKTK